MALFLLFLLSVYAGKHLFETNINKPLNISQAQILEIKSGMSFDAFTKLLVEKKWLDNRFWLRNYIRFINPKLSELKSGSYQIQPNTPLIQLLELLVAGKEYQYQITFVEGSTFKEWLALLASKSSIKQTLNNFTVEQIAQKLAIPHSNPEGLFFPDTYAYTNNASDVSILIRAHQRMTTVLASQWQQRQENLPYANSYEALIMASIIEKESGVLAEQPLIASVFINRLRKNMRLQTDPTVIYGLGDRYQGDIKTAHLKEKTLYNTYRINGLTPTPIAMPGIKAITAAMQPASSNYLYFVSNGYGQHVFSTNLSDHNKAVKQYLLNSSK